jgi:hypothetical protein
MNTLSPSTWFSRRVALPKHAPPSRMARPQAAAAKGLRFTEWLFIFVLSLAYLETVAQPVFGAQLHQSFLAHVPLALFGPILLLHLLGASLNRNPPPWQAIFALCWPLIFLGFYALIGSAIARWELKIVETYLAFAIYLLLLPIYVSMTVDGLRVRQWALTLICIWVLFSSAALLGESVRVRPETLHEIEYLVTAGFLVLYYAARPRWVKLLAFVALVAAMVVNQKLTGFLILALALLHIAVTAGWRRLPRAWRGFYSISALLSTAMLVVVLALLYAEYRQYLPSGNTDVRLKQYEAAMRQFVKSPLWGNAYLDGSGELYREWYRLLNIPTHSDLLDLLKHGGLIALGLFSWGYWKLFVVIHRAVQVTREQHLLNAYFVGVRFFQVAALVTFSFNPLLLKGPYLVVIWANLGLAAGMALALARQQKAKIR